MGSDGLVALGAVAASAPWLAPSLVFSWGQGP
jgi:hypothetical protein